MRTLLVRLNCQLKQQQKGEGAGSEDIIFVDISGAGSLQHGNTKRWSTFLKRRHGLPFSKLDMSFSIAIYGKRLCASARYWRFTELPRTRLYASCTTYANANYTNLICFLSIKENVLSDETTDLYSHSLKRKKSSIHAPQTAAGVQKRYFVFADTIFIRCSTV